VDILQTVATTLQENLGKELDQLARDCQVVHRERAFTGQSLLLMIVATLLHKPDATWTDFHLTAARLGLQITRTAVEKRFAAGQSLVDFLRSVLERALQKTVIGDPSSADLLQRFTAVLVGDASTIALPDDLADLFPGCGGTVGTSRAALKIQVLWDLKTNTLVQLHLEPGRASDAKSPIAVTEAKPGTLLIYDLGYFDLSRFAVLDTQQAKYVSRLQYGVQVYDTEDKPLNLLAYLSAQATGLVDREVVLGKSERLRCRLIAIRVPEEIANRRRQQARETARRKGRTPSEEYLELLGWSLFITNNTEEALTWKEVVVLYRARWQIELLFKLWKSHNQLARSRAGASTLEVLALFYAKLLGVVLQHWILVATAGLRESRSMFKAALALREMVKGLLLCLEDRLRMEEELRQLQEVIKNLGKKAERTKDPGYAQLIDDAEFLTWLC
jgi:Transposase DDE domain